MADEIKLIRSNLHEGRILTSTKQYNNYTLATFSGDDKYILKCLLLEPEINKESIELLIKKINDPTITRLWHSYLRKLTSP